MKSRVKRLKERRSEAVNTRGATFTYKPVSENKSLAVPAGRCKRCRKIVETQCVGCGRYTCKNHSEVVEETTHCLDCVTEKKSSTKQDYIG